MDEEDQPWVPMFPTWTKPETCEGSWHVSRPGHHKRCDCGEMRNPMYRTWWQRRKDRRQFKQLQKRRHARD